MNKLKFLCRKLFSPYPLEEVFTPSSSAELTFVRRTPIENKFHNQYKIHGKQFVVYGHSGSGKTTFLNRYFKENNISAVTIHCDANMSFQQIVLNSFDQLGTVFQKSGSLSETTGRKSNNIAEFCGLKSQGEVSASQTRVSGFALVVEPQTTPQRLAEALGKANKILVIEDFHKLEKEEKKKLSDLIKVFVDQANHYPNLKVICIGAVDTAREIVELDNNLKHRVCECEIPLLTDDEIRMIVTRGCELLNVSMSGNLVDRIVNYSNQLGAMAHQLSYDVCAGEGITKTQLVRHDLTGKHFEYAVRSYIDARKDTLLEIYDRAVKDSLGWYILRTFCDVPQSKMTLKRISKKVNKPEHPFTDNEIALKLMELSSADIGILRSDNNGYYYTVSDPFWGAYIKMKIAQEQADNTKAYRSRSLQLQDQNEVGAMLLKILLENYNAG